MRCLQAAFYRAHLDEHCGIAFAAMSAVMRNEQIASMIKDGQRWRDFEVQREGFLGQARESPFSPMRQL